MAPRGSRGRSVSPADARAYLAKAESWLEAATESLEVRRWDVAAGSAVTAGINACDAVLGSLLGQRAGGEHAQAIDWLQGAGADGRSAAHQLSQLLRYKTPAQYDPAPMSEQSGRKAVEIARRLTERAGAVVARTAGRRPAREPEAAD